MTIENRIDGNINEVIEKLSQYLHNEVHELKEEELHIITNRGYLFNVELCSKLLNLSWKYIHVIPDVYKTDEVKTYFYEKGMILIRDKTFTEEFMNELYNYDKILYRKFKT